MKAGLPPIAILAGGLATRLRPVTERIPKAMIEVAGEPFVAHQLRLLARCGFENVVLCIGHFGEQIRDFVGDGGRFGLSVRYCEDGPVLLGTGGAVARAAPALGEAFFVTWGDAYLDIDYARVWRAFRASNKPALMTVFRNEGRWDKSNTHFADGVVQRYDKRAPSADMAFIDYGVLVFRADALAEFDKGAAFDLADVQTTLAARGDMAGVEAERRFYEIGTPAGLAETAAFIVAGKA